MKKYILIIFGFIFVFSGCDDPFHQQLPNSEIHLQAPETHLQFFFSPDTLLEPGQSWVINGDTLILDDTLLLGLDTTVSQQVIHWWGDDPDGEIVGYYYQWSYMPDRLFTTMESDTFYLPLKTAFDIFTFRVWAVDNDSLVDSSPALVSFPVINTPPTIEWKLNSLPPILSDPDVVHKSFTHHSFFWDVYDLDGEATITHFYYAMDDTSSWTELPGTERSILVKNLSPGYHKFFIKAEDIAGAQSTIISFPDSLDGDHPNYWLVQEPIGDILIVNDYANDQLTFTHQNFYKSILTGRVGEDGVSTWEIGAARTNLQNSIPYSTEDIELNLSYFNKVFWFAYRGSNSISESALALTRFVANGGTLFMDNAMKDDVKPDTTWTFTQIDSVYSFSPRGRLFAGTKILADWGDTTLNQTLELSLSGNIADRLWAVLPGGTSTIRYQFEDGSLNSSDYAGTPPLMIETHINDGKCYYFSLPLFFCNGNNNIDKLFQHIFELDGK